MKMIMAIVGKDDEMETSAQLVAKGYFVTKIATSGGFLKRKHVTLMICTEDEKVDQAISIIQKYAGERKTVKYNEPRQLPKRPDLPGTERIRFRSIVRSRGKHDSFVNVMWQDASREDVKKYARGKPSELRSPGFPLALPFPGHARK